MKNSAKPSKIKIASDCINAMIFLGIDPINFAALKTQHGGLEQLSNFLASELGA